MFGLAVGCIWICGSGLGCVWIGGDGSGLSLDKLLWVGFCGLFGGLWVLCVMVVVIVFVASDGCLWSGWLGFLAGCVGLRRRERNKMRNE